MNVREITNQITNIYYHPVISLPCEVSSPSFLSISAVIIPYPQPLQPYCLYPQSQHHNIP